MGKRASLRGRSVDPCGVRARGARRGPFRGGAGREARIGLSSRKRGRARPCRDPRGAPPRTPPRSTRWNGSVTARGTKASSTRRKRWRRVRPMPDATATSCVAVRNPPGTGTACVPPRRWSRRRAGTTRATSSSLPVATSQRKARKGSYEWRMKSSPSRGRGGDPRGRRGGGPRTPGPRCRRPERPSRPRARAQRGARGSRRAGAGGSGSGRRRGGRRRRSGPLVDHVVRRANEGEHALPVPGEARVESGPAPGYVGKELEGLERAEKLCCRAGPAGSVSPGEVPVPG